MNDDEFIPDEEGPRAGKNERPEDASAEKKCDLKEFEKRWDEIEFLLRKPFCCK